MTPIGPELVIVQCKRYAPDKKVGEPTVKQLCAVVDVDDQKATRGLIVTTSTFTSVALKYIDWKKHKVSGADHVKLQEWMRIIRGDAPP
jgi:restriction system protein